MSTRRRPAAQKSGDAVATADRATRARGRRGPFTLPGDAREKEKKSGGACSAWFCAVCDVEDAPEWMIFNPHIRSGYRVGAVVGRDEINLHASQRDGEHMDAFVGVFNVRRAHRANVSDGDVGRGIGGAAEHWVTGPARA